MDEADAPPSGPPTDALEAVFHVEEVRTDGDRILYYGESLVPHDHLMEEVWPAFREAGYEVRLTTADRVDPPGDPSPSEPPARSGTGGTGRSGSGTPRDAADRSGTARETTDRSGPGPGSDPAATRDDRSDDPGTDPAATRDDRGDDDPGTDPAATRDRSPSGTDPTPNGGTDGTGGDGRDHWTGDDRGPGGRDAWTRDDRPRGRGTGDGGIGGNDSQVNKPGGTVWADPSHARSPHVLVAEPHSVGIDGIPWKNAALAVATVLSTLWAGAAWYHIDLGQNPEHIVHAWPFTVAIMGVLGVHEFGHYVMSRYHGVDASLPYFIPIPTLIGTMGAVIRMKGRMPDRKALFDIGIAGPLAGLVATIAVTAVGLHLDPVTVPEAIRNDPGAVQVHLGFPPLMYLIAWATGQPLSYPEGLAVNPVVIGGWVGMFVTFLNLIPVGQLDGGHVTRALLGERQRTLAAVVPAVLFGLAGYLYYFREVPGNAVFIWVFWGLFAAFFAFVGPAAPVEDEPLGRRRILVGALTLVLGALCFTPVPIAIIQ
ncbi:hypothetical protein BRD00_09525 [Halobacteriales archaeon QS_8_69_26]|nr:MAG: hypothetical protein BRD00_09525 [Halobacteriales archaeon QS_8_69_26]